MIRGRIKMKILLVIVLVIGSALAACDGGEGPDPTPTAANPSPSSNPSHSARPSGPGSLDERSVTGTPSGVPVNPDGGNSGDDPPADEISPSPTASPDGPHTGSLIWYQDWAAASSHAEARGKLILVNFYTDVCPWCRKLDQDTFSDAAVGEFVRENFVPLKINAANSSLSGRYGVRSVPTTVFLTSEGAEIAGTRVPGYAEAEPFLDFIQQLSAAWEDQ